MNGYQVETLEKKIDSFLGIPFAQPPTGNLRFRPPQPLNYTFDEYNATDLPPSCYQTLLIPVGEGFEDQAELAELWNPNTNFSEDCLYLNIWRPNGGFNKAVMVSLHSHIRNRLNRCIGDKWLSRGTQAYFTPLP